MTDHRSRQVNLPDLSLVVLVGWFWTARKAKEFPVKRDRD